MKVTDQMLARYHKVFVTSDFHFNHKSIIGFEPTRHRYSSVDEMDNDLIARWNSVVDEKDLVIFLGDFALCLDDRIIDRYSVLKGTKWLVRGNHDDRSESTFAKLRFTKVTSMIEYDQIVFTHVPIHPFELEYRWRANVHGHLHSKSIDDDRYVNVGIDHHSDFTLYTLSEIIDRLSKFPYHQKRQQ